MGFLQGAGPSNKTRLNEFSYDQHLFNDRIRFVVGRTTLASYFGTSELYCQFITTVCSNLGPFNWSANSNAPFWPISVWAGEVSFWPTKNLYLRAGASESIRSNIRTPAFPGTGMGHVHGDRRVRAGGDRLTSRNRPRNAMHASTILASTTTRPISRTFATIRWASGWPSAAGLRQQRWAKRRLCAGQADASGARTPASPRA